MIIFFLPCCVVCEKKNLITKSTKQLWESNTVAEVMNEMESEMRRLSKAAEPFEPGQYKSRVSKN